MSIVWKAPGRLHKTPWKRGIKTESVTEDKVWFFYSHQAHHSNRKQWGRLNSGKTIIPTRHLYTENCAALLRRSLTGNTELVENCDRSQWIGSSQLNQYLFVYLELLNNQRDAGNSTIYLEMIKYERVCMLMKLVQEKKVKDSKSEQK